MIAIVDYGSSNLTSVIKAFRAAGADPRIVRAADGLRGAAGIVVPGVGHFEATRAIDTRMRSSLRDAVDRGVPLLGICLGMQWLYAGSDEAPGLEGLGLFDAHVVRLRGAVKVPHVGWNTLEALKSSPLLEGVAEGSAVYFTHSYAAPAGAGTLATTEHGVPFAAIVERGHVAGMQFHPEKSGAIGLVLLRNWVSRAL